MRTGWILLALGFLAWFLAQRWSDATAMLDSLALWQPIAAFALMLAGKLVFVEVVRRILEAANAGRGIWLPFRAYSLSQLGKYIPGSIWQFVGRYGIYRSYGMASGRAVQFMLLENVLLIAVAFLISLGALPNFLDLALEWVSPPILAASVLAALVGLLGVFGLSARVRGRVAVAVATGWRHRRLVVSVAGLFAVMWVLFGLSAYVLLAGEQVERPAFPLFVISLYALSYVVGFVVVFAPAGVGIREAVFTVGLAGLIAPEGALILAVSHRLLYVLADLLMGMVAWGSRIGPSSSFGESTNTFPEKRQTDVPERDE
jgi:hypothetical protein